SPPAGPWPRSPASRRRCCPRSGSRAGARPSPPRRRRKRDPRSSRGRSPELMTERAPFMRRLLALLRVVLALLLLGWVGKNLPWSDELSFRDESGLEHVASG